MSRTPALAQRLHDVVETSRYLDLLRSKVPLATVERLPESLLWAR